MNIGFDYIGICTSFYCHDGKGNFLLHKRSQNCRDEQGMWDPGGGQHEWGITLEENVMKEVMEEYGCTGTISEILPTHDVFREVDGKKVHWVVVPFIILIDPSEVKNNEPHKIDELGWFRLDNLPQPLANGFKYTYGRYKEYFNKYNI